MFHFFVSLSKLQGSLSWYSNESFVFEKVKSFLFPDLMKKVMHTVENSTFISVHNFQHSISITRLCKLNILYTSGKNPARKRAVFNMLQIWWQNVAATTNMNKPTKCVGFYKDNFNFASISSNGCTHPFVRFYSFII